MFLPSTFFPPGPSRPPASFQDPIYGGRLAIGGLYPPSSVLHLSLAHIRHALLQELNEGEEVAGGSDPYVLIITSDRDSWKRELIAEADYWLTEHGGDGEVVTLLDKVDIRGCPTQAHFTFLMSTISLKGATNVSSSSFPHGQAQSIPKPAQHADRAVLPRRPTLLIVHELSRYLEEDSTSDGGIERFASHLALLEHVAHHLDTVASTSSLQTSRNQKRTPLVLFDSKLTAIELPIIPPRLRPSNTGRQLSSPSRQSQSTSDRRAAVEDAHREDGRHTLAPGTKSYYDRTMKLLDVVDFYYDWIGIHKEDNLTDQDLNLREEVDLLKPMRHMRLDFRVSNRISTGEKDGRRPEREYKFILEKVYADPLSREFQNRSGAKGTDRLEEGARYLSRCEYY